MIVWVFRSIILCNYMYHRSGKEQCKSVKHSDDEHDKLFERTNEETSLLEVSNCYGDVAKNGVKR